MMKMRKSRKNSPTPARGQDRQFLLPKNGKMCRFCGGVGKVAWARGVLHCGCMETPGQWHFGVMDQGHGHKSFAALDKDGDVIVELGDHGRNALMIVRAVNAYRKKAKGRGR